MTRAGIHLTATEQNGDIDQRNALRHLGLTGVCLLGGSWETHDACPRGPVQYLTWQETPPAVSTMILTDYYCYCAQVQDVSVQVTAACNLCGW